MLLAQGLSTAGTLDAPHDLLAFFGCKAEQSGDLPPIDLLIDDSKSMRGFLNAQRGGRLRQLIDQLVENGVGDHVEIRRLSAPARETIERKTELFDPDWYSEDTTRLEHAFRFAATRRNRIVILISDLEYSADDRDAREASASFTAMLRAPRKAILLLGMRSAFSNQRLPRCSPHCPAQTYRYFYLMVMAETPATLRLFVERTHIDQFAFDDEAAATNGWPLFYSGRPALEVTNIELVGDPMRGPWAKSRETANVVCADQALAHLQASLEYRETWPDEPLRMFVTVTVNVPVHNFSAAVPQIAKLERPRTSKWQSIPAAGLSHSAGGRAFMADKKIQLTYKFEKPKPATWDVYRISFKSEPANLEIPVWVSEWNKQVPASEDATPAVASLVRTMIREVTETIPLLEHYIAIGQN